MPEQFFHVSPADLGDRELRRGQLGTIAMSRYFDTSQSTQTKSTQSPMKEPELVTIVFGHLPAARLCVLLRTSSVWMLASDHNTRELDAAAGTMDLSSLPGQISSLRRAPNQDIADWLRTTLDEVDSHHDGKLWTQWKRIDIEGLELAPELEAASRDFGEVGSNEFGFRITRSQSDNEQTDATGRTIGGR